MIQQYYSCHYVNYRLERVLKEAYNTIDKVEKLYKSKSIDKETKKILIQILEGSGDPYITSPSNKDIILVEQIYGMFVNVYMVSSIVINRGVSSVISQGTSCNFNLNIDIL